MEQQTLKAWEVVEKGEVNFSPEAWDFLYQLSHGIKNPKTSLDQDTIDSMKNDPEFMEEVKRRRDDRLEMIRKYVKFSNNRNIKGIDPIELHVNTCPIFLADCKTDEAIDCMIDEFVKEVENKLKLIGMKYKIHNKENE